MRGGSLAFPIELTKEKENGVEQNKLNYEINYSLDGSKTMVQDKIILPTF